MICRTKKGIGCASWGQLVRALLPGAANHMKKIGSELMPIHFTVFRKQETTSGGPHFIGNEQAAKELEQNLIKFSASAMTAAAL